MATYSVKIDKNKITLGMMRRVSEGKITGVIDVVAALMVDENGVKPDRETAVAAAEEMSLAQLEEIAGELQTAFTPKAS